MNTRRDEIHAALHESLRILQPLILDILGIHDHWTQSLSLVFPPKCLSFVLISVSLLFRLSLVPRCLSGVPTMPAREFLRVSEREVVVGQHAQAPHAKPQQKDGEELRCKTHRDRGVF